MAAQAQAKLLRDWHDLLQEGDQVIAKRLGPIPS
jgi:23S rRNA maturation mini-RNase III